MTVEQAAEALDGARWLLHPARRALRAAHMSRSPVAAAHWSDGGNAIEAKISTTDVVESESVATASSHHPLVQSDAEISALLASEGCSPSTIQWFLSRRATHNGCKE